MVGFLIRLLLIWVACGMVLARFPAIESAAIRATVASVMPALRILGWHPIAFGAQIQALGVPIEVASDCTPTLAYVILFGAIAAYPMPLRRRLIGLAVGIPVLWIYNTLRVVTLIFVLARASRATFDLVHIYLWQSLTVAVVVGLFALLIQRADRAPTA